MANSDGQGRDEKSKTSSVDGQGPRTSKEPRHLPRDRPGGAPWRKANVADDADCRCRVLRGSVAPRPTTSSYAATTMRWGWITPKMNMSLGPGAMFQKRWPAYRPRLALCHATNGSSRISLSSHAIDSHVTGQLQPSRAAKRHAVIVASFMCVQRGRPSACHLRVPGLCTATRVSHVFVYVNSRLEAPPRQATGSLAWGPDPDTTVAHALPASLGPRRGGRTRSRENARGRTAYRWHTGRRKGADGFLQARRRNGQSRRLIAPTVSLFLAASG